MKKTFSFAVKPAACLMRHVFRGTVVVAALAAAGLYAAPTVTTLAGGVSGPTGYKDTNSLFALFKTPIGIAVDQGNDNLYVADRDNNAVRLLDLVGGQTYTFATNQVNKPVGVVLDGDDNVYVLNRGTGTTVSTNGTVLEFDYYGYLIATNASNLTNAAAIAIDPAGNLYVTERTNLLVRLTTTNPVPVATVTIPNAFLQGISVMANGMIAACDYNRNGIYTIDPNTGIVTTNAGFNGQGDGTGIENRGVFNSRAQFFQPYGVVASGDGTLIVTDFGNDRVKVVTASGITTNFYGVASNVWLSPFPGWRDGTVSIPDLKGGVSSRSPAGVALSVDGSAVYTTEDFYSVIRKVSGTSFQAMPALAPAAPTGLTATVVTNGNGVIQVNLNWTPISDQGVTNYLVERAGGPGGPYAVFTSTTGTTASDTNVVGGSTYYYVVQAANSGGVGEPSSEASAFIPILPPIAPNIGWFDFEGNFLTGFFATLHPVPAGNPYIANNPINIAIDPVDTNSGLSTFYITIPPATNVMSASWVATNGSTPPTYRNNTEQGVGPANPLPILPLSNGMVTIEAVNVNGIGENSGASLASFLFEMGTPVITGNNAAQFTLLDVSTNATFYYTLDGSDPTNAPASQQIVTTNGTATLSLNGSTNILFQVRAIGEGQESGYLMSGIAQQAFSTTTFVPNSISFGFASGEASSQFIGAPGETFIAPVTMNVLPTAEMYSLQFNLTVTNAGPNPGPAIASGAYAFDSDLLKPVGNGLYATIFPYMFIGNVTGGVPPGSIVSYEGTNFVDLETTNTALNLIGVGWLERFTQTNLYNTLSQDLIQFSRAHDTLFVQGGGKIVVGEYSFTIPANATLGQTYQMQIGRPTATSDGIGAPGSSVYIATPTNGSLAAGPINSIKDVTVGSIPYIVGDCAPFNWFNAGDFGNSNLESADLEQVFEWVVYGLNQNNPQSDFADSMDSCGKTYVDSGNGYLVPSATAPTAPLFNGNDTSINNIAFGDGVLNVCDIYVTFRRSLDPSLTWFERFWTNDIADGYSGRAALIVPNTFRAGAVQTKVSSRTTQVGAAQNTSITNQPKANFLAGDYLASPGQTIQIPVNAQVFGNYPLRVMALNVSVVPLDGSPALTTPVQFTQSTTFGQPAFTDAKGPGNYAAAWLDSTITGLSGNGNLGTVTITIPINATASSAYAVHFDHASGSPNGIAAFPGTKYTGLITLSSRTNSTYGDGIPDLWRLRYFGTIYNELSVSNADADGTGVNNWQKYVAGLDPTDPTSVLNEGMDQAAAQNKQDFVLYWPSVTGKTYVIQRSSTLFPPHWTSISTNSGDGTYMEIHDSNASDNGYYRVSAQ